MRRCIQNGRTYSTRENLQLANCNTKYATSSSTVTATSHGHRAGLVVQCEPCRYSVATRYGTLQQKIYFLRTGAMRAANMPSALWRARAPSRVRRYTNHRDRYCSGVAKLLEAGGSECTVEALLKEDEIIQEAQSQSPALIELYVTAAPTSCL